MQGLGGLLLGVGFGALVIDGLEGSALLSIKRCGANNAALRPGAPITKLADILLVAKEVVIAPAQAI